MHPEDDGAEGLVAAARQAVVAARPVPLPGSGATARRWQVLADLGRQDLALVRIVEGHLDAEAILHELGSLPAGPDELLAVWAARPEELRATRVDGGWRLDGAKPFCSGADLVDRALVTAAAADGPRLLLVEAGAASRCPGSWQPLGMRATRTETMVFDGALVPAAAAIGAPGAYVDRPGFGQGGCGVAACWWGGAQGLLDDLRRALQGREDDLRLDAYARAALAVRGAALALRDAAARIDDAPRDVALGEHHRARGPRRGRRGRPRGAPGVLAAPRHLRARPATPPPVAASPTSRCT